MITMIPIIFINNTVEPNRYIVIRYRQIIIPIIGRIRWPCNFFVCFLFPRTSNARHVSRNANAKLNTENEIKSESPEKMQRAKAIIP